MDAISQSIDKQTFLKLFTTQLKYQDPLNPLENTEFTAQLAQFSSLEQLIDINSNLSSIINYQDSLNNALATNLIGRSVVVDGNRIQYNGSEVKIKYTLSQPATSVKAEIFTEMGEPVRTISLGYQSAGEGEILWDGKDNSGNSVQEGSYRVQLNATDEAGNPVDIVSDVQSRIIGIKFENNITYLILENGMRVSLSEIKAINEGGV